MSGSVQTFPQRVQNASKVMKITEEKLYSFLSELGIRKDDDDAIAILDSEYTAEGDARAVFVDRGKVPIARFKNGWAVLKGKADKSESLKNETSEIIKALRNVDRYSDRELLQELYKDGINCSSEVMERLNKISKDRPFLVFDGEKLDIEMSLKMLQTAKRQPTTENFVIYEGKETVALTLFRVGYFPTLWLEESPIHSDVVLINGYCQRCENTWDGIGIDDRVIVRVAVEDRIINPEDKASIHNLISKIREEGNAQFLLKYPTTKKRYDRLSEENRLPVLRRRMTSGTEKKDPFFVHRTLYLGANKHGTV